MKKSIKLRIIAGVLSKEMFLSLFAGTIMLTQPIWIYLSTLLAKENLPTGVYLFYICHSKGCFDIFAPALAVLPYSSCFIDEYSSKNTYFIISRAPRAIYYVEHIMTRSLCGGLATSLPNIILLLFCIAYGTPYLADNIPNGFSTLFKDTVLETYQFQLNGYMVPLIVIFLTFVFGVVWANIGMLFAVAIPNKYASVAFPIMTYFFISLVFYVLDWHEYSPMSFIIPQADKIESIFHVLTCQLVLLLFLICIIVYLLHRRLKNA